MLQVGLNPYGLTYWLGLQERRETGTDGTVHGGQSRLSAPGMERFVGIAEELDAKVLEIHNAWLTALDDPGLSSLRERLASAGMTPVISLGPPLEAVDTAISNAAAVGARIVRLGLTPVLCGDRAACGAEWPRLLERARSTLRQFAPRAADLGLAFAIENHQDLGSRELIDLCADAGSNVGVCLDTGNPLAVGEDCAAFARRVAPLVRHVHLKDYRAQWTDDGYRLVRCAIGDGAVPFRELAGILEEHHPRLTASLEPGALNARHVRLFRREWWAGYEPRTAAEFAECLAAARRNRLEESADWRTPWEREDPPEVIIQYELEMIRRSAANMRALGLM